MKLEFGLRIQMLSVAAGREISEEEGDMRLTPSSTIVGGLVCEQK